ncbi:MAG TPA: hypothetical protein VHS76_16410 [Steroidobacteraceae bacterium]|jgi:hypothetical protein|nr:hypothetical protein [Steroidobacteraceae bacterium]
MAAQTAAIGFSPHSGWAAMVVLGGTAAAPTVLTRSRVELIDDHDPESKQPYHAVEFLCVEEATGRLDGYLAVATGKAQAALRAQVEQLKGRDISLKSVGIIDSSSRKQVSLQSILASHALIHAAEGDHFRNALYAAAEHCGLGVYRVPAKELEAHAGKCLRTPPSRMLDVVSKLGRDQGPPWGADQKKAALLAWTLLKQDA